MVEKDGLEGVRALAEPLEKQPPGLKPGNLYAEHFRGFENPLPRTDARCGEVVRGWHHRSGDPLRSNYVGPEGRKFFRNLQKREAEASLGMLSWKFGMLLAERGGFEPPGEVLAPTTV